MADCPICQAPEGTCRNELHYEADVKTIDWQDDRIAPDTHPRGTVVAAERIWREVPIWHSDRTKRVLAYAPGMAVSDEDVIELRVGPDGRQKGETVPDLEGTEDPDLQAPGSGPVVTQDGPPLESVPSTPEPLVTT